MYFRSQNLNTREMSTSHSHRWSQFVYAISGVLLVTVADNWFVITPEQAMWLPTGTPHATGALQQAEFRSLYVADQADLRMPPGPTMLSVSPLLKALIVELSEIEARNDEQKYIEQVNALIIEQLNRQPRQDFHLPWPNSSNLRAICEALYAEPADPRSIQSWGGLLGASPRTLARHFEQELGMSLREWRRRLRLFRSLEWLGVGRSVTDIAFNLGYASPSAFIYMFRQEMGYTPSRWGESK